MSPSPAEEPPALVSLVVQAWIVIAVVLALAEAVMGGFYSMPWAIGAALAAGLAALHVSPGWQWLTFLGVSSVLLVVVQRNRLKKG